MPHEKFSLRSSARTLELALKKAEDEKRELEAELSRAGWGSGGSGDPLGALFDPSLRVGFRLQQLRDKISYLKGLIELKRREASRRSGAASDQLQPPAEAARPKAEAVRDRRAKVDAFLLKCNHETSLKRTHIWRAAGHNSPRQFQFWQALDPKATGQDDQNFRRILAMSPTDFVALLEKKGIV